MASTKIKPLLITALQAVVFILIIIGAAKGQGTFTAVNNCESEITVTVLEISLPFSTDLPRSYDISSGGSKVITLSDFVSGIWGSPSGNTNARQCTQVWLFSNASTLGVNGDGYFVFIDPAYNIGVEIRPTFFSSGDPISESSCPSTSCIINNIQSVCQQGNSFAGPDNACIVESTSGAELFEQACLQASIALSNTSVIEGHIFLCELYSSYDVTFCPTTSSAQVV